MSGHAEVHAPVGGKILTRPMLILLAIAAVGGLVALWRFVNGIGSVSALNNGYPWGVWISVDVVIGTALGCGGYAVGLLVYILNKGRYHPLLRPAVLTSLLGYGLAVIAVTIDLGRFWELWKVPVFFWRWSHSPSSRSRSALRPTSRSCWSSCHRPSSRSGAPGTMPRCARSRSGACASSTSGGSGSSRWPGCCRRCTSTRWGR